MGAGVSMKRRYEIRYRMLKRIQRELAKAEIYSLYRHLQLVSTDGEKPQPVAFNISVDLIGPASNGEMAFAPLLWLREGAFGGWGRWEKGNRVQNPPFDKGIKRLKELVAEARAARAAS